MGTQPIRWGLLRGLPRSKVLDRRREDTPTPEMIAIACIAAAFVAPAPLPSHFSGSVVASRAVTNMGIPVTVKLAVAGAGVAGAVVSTKAFMAKRDADAATRGRQALSGMSTLSDLQGLSLEEEEKENFRVLGDW